MPNVYLTKQKSKISKCRKRLIVEHEDEKIADIPLINVEQVIVIGSIGITGAMIQSLLAEGIPITYLSYYGKFKGRLVPKTTKNSVFRLEQFRKYEDEEFCLQLSKEIVTGKLKNMKTLLLRDTRNKRTEEVNKINYRLGTIIEKVALAETLDELRGYEGKGTSYYFGKLDMVLNDEFVFKKRTRRPPKDPVNSLLSFGYSLLLNNVISALYLAGFDPYIGYFHSLKYGKPSLALDLMEEFRQTIVDSVVKTVVNKNILTPEDFRNKDDGILLEDEGRKTFIRQFEKRLNTEVTHPNDDYTASWKKMIEYQAKLLRDVVKEEKEYQALMVK